jgi:hypothetical protein
MQLKPIPNVPFVHAPFSKWEKGPAKPLMPVLFIWLSRRWLLEDFWAIGGGGKTGDHSTRILCMIKSF